MALKSIPDNSDPMVLVRAATVGRSRPYAAIGRVWDLGNLPSRYGALVKKVDESVMPGTVRIVTHDFTTIWIYNVVTAKAYEPTTLRELSVEGFIE